MHVVVFQLGSLPALIGASLALNEFVTSNVNLDLQAITSFVATLSAIAIVLQVVGVVLRHCEVGFIYWDIKRFLRTV